MMSILDTVLNTQDFHMLGTAVQINLSDGIRNLSDGIRIGSSTVISTDIVANNGIIHSID